MPAPERARRSEFGDHLAEMRYRWKAIALATIVAALVVGAWRSTTPDTFASTAGVRLALASELTDDGTSTAFQTQALAELARTPAVLTDALEASGLELDLPTATARVTVELRDTPGFLDVRATGPSPEAAASLADALAEELVDVVADDPNLAEVATASIAVPASVPDGPVSPRPVAEAILAALFAALATAEGLIAWRKLRGRLSPVAPASEIERLLGVPTLHAGTDSSTGETTSALPFVIQHLDALPIVTVLQRGSRADARVAAMLGRIISGVHRRVLMIDADLGQPVLHETVGTELSPGLSEVLEGRQTLGRVLQRATDGGRAAIVAAGEARPDGVNGRRRLVETDHLVRASQADRVILSTTQNSSYDDALTAVHVFGDAVVLAVDPGISTRELRRIARDVRDAAANLAAVVVIEPPDAPDAANGSSGDRGAGALIAS